MGAVDAPTIRRSQALKAQILEFDRRILAWHRSNETNRRLDAIPGIGPALATALVASVADPKAFRRDGTSQPGSGSCRSSTRAGGDPLCQDPWLPASTLEQSGQ